MTRPNILVSYAPAHPAATRTADGGRVPTGTGITGWKGALLAGGALCALGLFVRWEAEMPAEGPDWQPAVAPSHTGTIWATAPTAAPSLPFLALVRDTPVTAPLATITLSPGYTAPVKPEKVAPQPPRSPVAERSRDKPREIAVPARQAAKPARAIPSAGQRRDLEGFLADQGLELVPDTSRPVPASVDAWSDEDLLAGAQPQRAAAEMASASGESTEPSAGITAPSPPELNNVMVVEESEPAVQPVAAASDPGLATQEETPPPPPPPDAGNGDSDQRIALAMASPDVAAPQVAESPSGGLRARSPLPSQPSSGVRPVAMPSSLPEPDPPATASPEFEQSYPQAVVAGETLGALTLRDFGQNGQVIDLAALVGLLRLKMPEADYTRFRAASAGQFVTLDRLRAAGFSVEFDRRRGRLLITVQ